MEFPLSSSVCTYAELEVEINPLLFSLVLELSSMYKSEKKGIEYERILTEDQVQVSSSIILHCLQTRHNLI